MGLFTKKKKVEMKAYYIIGDNLYQFRKVVYLTEKESNITRDEFFDLYGFRIRKYNIECGDFDMWYEKNCFSLSENPYDMSKAVEVREEELDTVIEIMKKAFEKKFNDFELNETLYTYNKDHYDTFPPVAKVIKKLVNKQEENIANKFILELEVLDGQEGAVKRVFTKFFDFINDYDAVCPIEVIDSIDMCETTFEDYFSKLGIL